MKKIYLSIAAAALFGSATAQLVTKPRTQNNLESHKLTNRPVRPQNTVAKTAAGGGHFQAFFGDATIQLKQYTEDTEYSGYVNPIFVDSTVASSSSSGLDYVFNMKAGVNFDPVSILWGDAALGQPGSQVLASPDAYVVDSVFIGGLYRRVNHNVVDTLLIECVWGARSNASVFTGLSMSTATPALQFVAPKTNSTTASGDPCYLSAPTTNYKRIKYPLTDADTGRTNADFYKVIPGINQSVPGGNVFSVAYTFIPGQTVAPGSIVWQYQGGAAQTTNGWIGGMVTDPATNPTGNYFYDNTSRSSAIDYYSYQRYGRYTGGSAFLNNVLLPSPNKAWDIGLAITYTGSTVGIKENETKGFSLDQNIPNPYSGESVVGYSLTKDASSAVFTVTDVMGRILSSEKVSSSVGTHSVKLGSYSAGIYYYSLNVDGNVTTNKMIVE